MGRALLMPEWYLYNVCGTCNSEPGLKKGKSKGFLQTPYSCSACLCQQISNVCFKSYVPTYLTVLIFSTGGNSRPFRWAVEEWICPDLSDPSLWTGSGGRVGHVRHGVWIAIRPIWEEGKCVVGVYMIALECISDSICLMKDSCKV